MPLLTREICQEIFTKQEDPRPFHLSPDRQIQLDHPTPHGFLQGHLLGIEVKFNPSTSSRVGFQSALAISDAWEKSHFHISQLTDTPRDYYLIVAREPDLRAELFDVSPSTPATIHVSLKSNLFLDTD